MAPKREPCRNFQRGSCQYGDRCKFLHVTPQQAKPNPFGFGTQTNTQFQHTNSQPQKPNPFGFGVQNSSQNREVNSFGSKPNQFKPGENKWTRFSPINAASSPAPRQPDNQSSAPNHTCTDSESCKRQIIEDFEHERPLWKLTCYGHSKNGPCDVVGDISCEELRAAAYDDAKRGLSLQSIVEKERNLLNSKLVEFESLLRNPYAVPPNSTLASASQSLFSGDSSNVSPPMVQNNAPPSVSSFSQLGASFNTGPAAPNNAFGQVNAFQASSQISNASQKNSFSFGNAGSLGSQPPVQSFGSPFTSSTPSFGNGAINAERNPFATTAISPSPSLASNQFSMPFNGPNASINGVDESAASVLQNDNTPRNKNADDNSIWSKEWKRGEIPEDEPPVEVRY